LKEVEYLAEWFIRYIKNRDLYFKRIKDIAQKDGLVIVEEKTRTVQYQIISFAQDLKGPAVDMKEEEHYGIVLYNTEENFKALLSAWAELSKVKNLIVYFINPFSKLDKQWVIYPHTHNRITEKESLKTGLRTMFETVEATSKEEIKKITA